MLMENMQLKSQLRNVTKHLIGLAAATARLPILHSDQPLRADMQSVTAALDSVPTSNEMEFRSMIASTFPTTLRTALDLLTPEIGSKLLPLYQQWHADAL